MIAIATRESAQAGPPIIRNLRRIAWCISTIVTLAPMGANASRLDDALEAGETGANYLEGALAGLYQNAAEASEDTGNYEVDLIGSLVLRSGMSKQVGDTDLVFWLFSVDNLGGLQPTGQMSRNARLLWGTNDINVDSSTTQFGVLGFRQFFFGNRLELGFGKVFPGMIHTESAYTANNSETFSSKLISSSAIGGYFEAIGRLVPTRATDESPSAFAPGLSNDPACWTRETVRPSQGFEKRCTRRIVLKPRSKFTIGPRVIATRKKCHQHKNRIGWGSTQHLASGGANRPPPLLNSPLPHRRDHPCTDLALGAWAPASSSSGSARGAAPGIRRRCLSRGAGPYWHDHAAVR